MNFDLKACRRAQNKARIKGIALIWLLTLGLGLIWHITGRAPLSQDERRLWNKVRNAEKHVLEWRLKSGSALSDSDDPWRTGLVGLEWSPLSTTVGSLPAKRTACDPAWSLAALRWFDALGLTQGDPVAVASSSSFPGMMLNVLAAAEERGLDVHLAVSLGSSTWGCNDPVSPWPVMARELRKAGFLRTRAEFYTLGGEDETGGGISPEGIEIMTAAAKEAGVPVVCPESLKAVTEFKTDWIKSVAPKAVISIGGSEANMGKDPAVLSLPPGILRPRRDGGDGLIGLSLKAGYPVIHLLNIRELSVREGIGFDSLPGAGRGGRASLAGSLAGLGLFALAMAGYRRFSHGLAGPGSLGDSCHDDQGADGLDKRDFLSQDQCRHGHAGRG